MRDYREHKKSMFKSVTRLAGIAVNEDTVKEMLTAIGVDPTPEIVGEAVGFLSSNGMEFTMENLYQFLKSKQIVSKRDMRKKN